MKNFIINKSDTIQRTSVFWVKKDIKPWEIIEVRKDEADYIIKAYWNIFWRMDKIKTKEVKIKVKKKITK